MCNCATLSQPTFWNILTERPTAFWHAFFAFGRINQLPNRLVGPGRLEKMEEWIEERYASRHSGTYKQAGAGYDHNPLFGKPINGGEPPVNRRGTPDEQKAPEGSTQR